MDFVKNLFWGPDETVIQFHPPVSRKVNYHPFCLHLWRHASIDDVFPPPELVGPLAKEAT